MLVSSPALDAGDLSAPGSGSTSCATTDERGVTRPVGSACDIGAFEANQGGETSSYDLSVTNAASSTTATVGSNLTFTITLHNSNSDTATGILLTDSILPFNFVSLSTPAGWSCNTPAVGASGLVTCTKPSVEPSTSSPFVLVVAPSAGNLGNQVSNTAAVTSGGNDTDLSNNSSTIPGISIIDPPTDLSVAVSGTSASVNVGGNVTYTVIVKNTGSKTDDVQLTDHPQAGMTVNSVLPSQGACQVLPTVINCSLGSIANGATATLTIVATALASGVPQVSNSASVSAPEVDPNPFNNSDTATTTVTNISTTSDFSFSISPANATVPQGGTVSYPITLIPSGGFIGTIAFTCTGMPVETSCSSFPSPVSITGTTPVQANLIVLTTAPSRRSGFSAPVIDWNLPVLPAGFALFGLMALSLVMVLRSPRARMRSVCFASLMALLLVFTGCGSGATLVGGTPQGTYTITVTATSAQKSHTSTITVVVGP